jgi:hypothetical protein
MNQVIIGNENTNDAQGTLLHSKNIGLRAHVKSSSASQPGPETSELYGKQEIVTTI